MSDTDLARWNRGRHEVPGMPAHPGLMMRAVLAEARLSLGG